MPALLISGTVDRTTPPKANTDRPWRLVTGQPAYRVDIADAGHQAFTDVGRAAAIGGDAVTFEHRG